MGRTKSQEIGADAGETDDAFHGADEAWATADHELVFLLDTNNFVERNLIRSWVARHRPPNVDAGRVKTVPIWRSSVLKDEALDRGFEKLCTNDKTQLFTPLRLVWIPKATDEGGWQTGVAELMRLANPPLTTLARQLALRGQGNASPRVIAGRPATLTELRERWNRAIGNHAMTPRDFAEYVARQATLALEVAERKLRGPRYKIPKLVRQEISQTVAFKNGIQDLARKLGRSEHSVHSEALDDLKEIAAGHSPPVIEGMAALSRGLYTQAYDSSIDYDNEALRRIGELGRKHPLVFLPTHKSYMDHLVLRWAMHETGIAPNHVAAGVNLAFFPLGALGRRAGMFFIRRTFQDDAVYKFALRRYIDFLIQKRFSLEWYIEGGRSRTGKMLPPRFGMLAYVADAYMRGAADDVLLIPTSIVYDQLLDVSSYANEAAGVKKQSEDLGFALRYIRGLSNRFGSVCIRFGEPVSIREQLGPPTSTGREKATEQHLDLKKVAFEVAVRINQVTPITPTSLVTMAMLGVRGRALSLKEVQDRVRPLCEYAKRRELPMTQEIRADDKTELLTTLRELMHHRVVDSFDEGPEAVYQIGPERYVSAAYYRNAIIHFFLNISIVELSLVRAQQQEDPEAALSVFWKEAFELRDLFKFEFFFSEKEAFKKEIQTELNHYDEKWEAQLKEGPEGAARILVKVQPYNSHRVLRSFVEAYRVAADVLAGAADLPLEPEPFVEQCMGLGRQYLLQRRIESPESVSNIAFKNAFNLAKNYELILEDGRPERGPARQAFSLRLKDVERRINFIQAAAESRLSTA